MKPSVRLARRVPWLALLPLCFAVAGAAAQTAACGSDAEPPPLEALFGRWEARIEGQPGTATVRLARHPEYAGVRGEIVRAGARGPAQLAGDVGDDGQLAIDESADGRSISAVWVGAWRPGSCGRIVEGTWRDAADDSTHTFVLTKTAPAP